MIKIHQKSLKLSLISLTYNFQKIPISFTLAFHLPEGKYKLVPQLKTEEHYLIANAANKFYELVALNDEKT
jgi:hypothetical protein